MDLRNYHEIGGFIAESINKGMPLPDIYAVLNKSNGAIRKPAFYQAVLAVLEAGRIPNDYMVCMCGIDCSRCRAFRATAEGDGGGEAREVVAGYYKEIGHDIAAEDIRCFGCRSGEMMPGCAECPYLKCGKSKGLKRCAECGEYPCESLRWYTEKYIKPGMGKFIKE